MNKENLDKVANMLLQAQGDMNAIVNPDWHNANYPFMRAAWCEASEAFGHLSWEWWKDLSANFTGAFRQETDIAEYHMELVDCLHFLVSQALLDGWHPHALRNALELPKGRMLSNCLDDAGLTLDITEDLVDQCLNGNARQALRRLVTAAESTGLGLGGLLTRYFAKNTLNRFRQDHGYKDKTYIKIWGDGREDNFYLNRLLDSLTFDGGADPIEEIASGAFQNAIYFELQDLYGRVQRTGHCYHEAAEAR